MTQSYNLHRLITRKRMFPLELSFKMWKLQASEGTYSGLWNERNITVQFQSTQHLAVNRGGPCNLSLRPLKLKAVRANKGRSWKNNSDKLPTAASLSRQEKEAGPSQLTANEEPFAKEDILLPTLFKPMPHVIAGITMREFGNMSMSQVGAPQCDNFLKLEARMALEGYGWVLPQMVHGNSVVVVDSPGRQEDCDALVTRSSKLLLCVTAADCGTVLLCDPVAEVVGVCHCGWRGTVAGIASSTVQVMREQGAIPERIRTFIGPCISTEHFEVGEEVALQFSEQFVVRENCWPRPHVDLKGAIEEQLREQGIEAVEVHPGCTVANQERFFSHRASKGSPERMIAFIALR